VDEDVLTGPRRSNCNDREGGGEREGTLQRRYLFIKDPHSSVTIVTVGGSDTFSISFWDEEQSAVLMPGSRVVGDSEVTDSSQIRTLS